MGPGDRRVLQRVPSCLGLPGAERFSEMVGHTDAGHGT